MKRELPASHPWARHRQKLSPPAMALLTYLRSLPNAYGTEPELLATGDAKIVRDAIRELEAAGLIEASGWGYKIPEGK